MSFLKKMVRGGSGVLAKGLFRKYEHQLSEEEAEADLLRKQHLASYENSLLTQRAKTLADYESGIRKQEREDTYDFEKQKALEKSDLEDQIIEKDAGKLFDSLEERGATEGLDKNKFKSDMLFIHRASKGATPLTNDQKIEIIKNANEAWDKLSTMGGPEYDTWTAKYGAKARDKFIESQINSSVFGGTSDVDKAGKIVSEKKQKDILAEIKAGDPEEMIKKIMKTQNVKRKEAEDIYSSIIDAPMIKPGKTKKRAGFLDQIGARFNVEEDIPERVEKPSFLDYNL